MSAKTTPYCYPLYIVIIMLVTFPFCVKSQHKIYLENGFVEGKLSEITRDKIKFNRPENPGPLYSVKRNRVKIIFNESGNYLIPKSSDETENTSEDVSVADFLNSSGAPAGSDKIFTLNNMEIGGKILKEDALLFTINTGRQTPLKIKRSEVACVVYKSGKHQLIASVSASVEVLKTIANSKASLALQNEISAIPEKKEEPVIKPAEQPVVKEKEITPPPPTVVTEEKKEEPVIKPAEQPAVKEKEITPPAPTVGTEEKKEEPVIEKPVEKVDSVKIKLLQQRAYDSLVSIGNKQLLSDLPSSLSTFRQVLEVKPGDYYASKQIRYLEGEITRKEEEKRIAEENRKIEEAENRYKEAIRKGDRLKTEKNYEEALSAYKDALAIHPDDAYVKRMVDILTYQLSLKKNHTEENKP